MAYVTFQGVVATDGSTKITCTTSTLTVDSIIVTNNSANYVLTYNRCSIDLPTITIVPIYELTLDSGDTVTDTEQYVLNTGEYIQLISDVAGTTYSITANVV
jgi:hypothetical protein